MKGEKMIDESFVGRIVELARETPTTLEIDGRNFVAIGGELKNIRPPHAEPLEAAVR